jgi:4-hydroxy-3-methylbut-2-enyl diphosphate reductase
MSILHNQKVLLRAHGEPPSTYIYLKSKGVDIIDATCPVVIKLQEKVRNSWEKMKKENGQIVIYGKKGHPEVIGLIGQTNGEAIVISGAEDLKDINLAQPVEIFSQTTMSNDGLIEIEDILKEKNKNIQLTVHHSICEHVANRVPHLKNFAKQYEIIIFVGGEKSSNGKMLFDICKNINPFTYYTHSYQTIEDQWFQNNPKSVGICGATSTPHWLMKKVAEKVNKIVNKTVQ